MGIKKDFLKYFQVIVKNVIQRENVKAKFIAVRKAKSKRFKAKWRGGKDRERESECESRRCASKTSKI